ncbi:Fur family transcriptional regulator [Clostridium prolinivorans]|jgi:Fe2+ or Zn2+ uptake regulation protein|uniref:Fur family transcriptional regulator n=1 Tax=Clostridium prolinivorans TaxID=2769420 RepID=UPI000FDC4C3D|nr:Fur family transcriptional regulator [Clostridium prolinivorans]
MEPENLLKKNNIKVTKGRIAILNILLSTEDAVTVDYIYEQCKKRGLKIDLSTIYRTMDILENKNIIEKLNLGEDKFSYIIKKENHKHILECSLCHKEVEIDCPMLQIEEIIKNKTGFVLTEHDLKIKGICDECKNHSK